MRLHFPNPIHNRQTKRYFFLGSFCALVLGLLIHTGIPFPSTQASWMQGSFINQDFWNQGPSTGNILYSLFGDGTPGATPYTRLWTNSCIPTNMQILPPTFAGGSLQANTVYLLNSGTYTLTSPLSLSGCSALMGIGSPSIKTNSSNYLQVMGKSRIIIDNLMIDGQSIAGYGLLISGSQNISLHADDFFQFTWPNIFSLTNNGPSVIESDRVLVDHSAFYANALGLTIQSSTNKSIYINNSKFFNNSYYGIYGLIGLHAHISNSQFFNNTNGMSLMSSGSSVSNSLFYNNTSAGMIIFDTGFALNTSTIYNNGTGISLGGGTINAYGNTRLFANDIPVVQATNTVIDTTPVSLGVWTAGSFETGADSSMNYDWTTNPQNASGSSLLSGSNRSSLRGPQSFSLTPRPFRYIFGSFIPKQTAGILFSGTAVEYGSNGQDYDDSKYITELDPAFVTADMSLIQNYFGSGAWYTQNRENNPCSLGSFQIVSLSPASIGGSSYTLQDHTIYLLSGGEYLFSAPGNGFVFGGNCIALIGQDTTKIDKSNGLVQSLLYATNKHHLIIDNLRIDGKFYGQNGFSTTAAQMGIRLDGSSNNTTIHRAQVYNMQQYGIFLGVSSHHNSIINSQTYNNGEAGIYLYLASNYNVINNDQSYNNSGYGIWFANGSHNNAMNNFQSYNNSVGVFADLTTSSNIINRAMLYNNSSYGLYFKNSSGNILNDLSIYHNTVGIHSAFNSANNTFLGELMVFDNLSGDFEGTNADDASLKAGAAMSPFSGGVKTLGAGLMGCPYVTNPTLSGTSTSFLNTGADCSSLGNNFSVFSGLSWDIGYVFGANIYKQGIPVYYASGALITQAPSQYDSGKYIAEIFPIWDTTPENFSFASTGNLNFLTGYTTAVYTASIINIIVPITLQIQGSTGHLIINGQELTGSTGYVRNGDAVQIFVLSRSGFSAICTGIVTLGNVSTSFTVGSRGPITTPTSGSFIFAPATGAAVESFVPSSFVTIQGIETGVMANFSSLSSGWLEVYTGTQFVSSGTNAMVSNGNRVRLVVKSSASYQDLVTGTLAIGTGNGDFLVWTLPDTIPPEISFIETPSLSGYRSQRISILFTGANVFSGYQFVSTPSACSGSLSTGGWIPYTTGLLLTGPQDQYICAYAKDIGNNIMTGVTVSPLHISDLSFSDAVSPSAVSYDTVSIGNAYVMNKKYAIVSNANQCLSGGAAFQNYSGTIVFNSFLYNGKYVCAYGEDASGSGRYLLSSSSINIDPNMPTILFSDPVNSGFTRSDTISLQVVGGLYTQLGYKYIDTPSDCSASGTVAYTGAIVLQTQQYNGKYFCAYVGFSGYTLPLVSSYPINIDITGPSVPIALAPTNQESTFFLLFQASGSNDLGAGVSGYLYQIAQDASFLDIISTGSVFDASNFSPLDFDTITGTYYRRIQAVDRLGNTSNRSNIGSFTLTDDSSFAFSSQENAKTDNEYDSNTITIGGLRSGAIIWASVDNGTLFKNERDKGVGTFVQNGDKLFVRLTSSANKGRTVSSTLTIANRSAEYLINTRDTPTNTCSVSTADKQSIQIIFDNLISQYQGDQTKYAEFLSTMKSMLQDQIDLSNDCTLTYLSDLVSQGLDQGTIDTQAHTAPNCKSYAVSYATGKLAYTSPSLKNVIYFATRDALTRFIDSKNPGDCHINTYTTTATIFSNTDPSRHIAPNGKIYTINTTTSNGYTSPELSQVKYFPSITALRAYLDSKNPPQKVRNHLVDSSFSPLNYLSPNGKQYTIYKTDKGYMSYKLLQVKYFSTLADIKAYINRNNTK